MSEGVVAEVIPHEQVVHIIVHRRILDEQSTQELVDAVYVAAGQQARVPIVLDMSRVKFAPSVALGSLVHLSKSFQLDGRRVALVSVDQRIRGTIHVTQLNKVLDIRETLEDFIRSLPKS
mgnify:CR=1 FL=1